MQAVFRSFVMFLLLASSTLPAQMKSVAERLGYPAGSKLLILHGDDLGAAHSVDVASFDGLDRGAISSASVMMPTPWVTEVAAYARAHPKADIGIHLTLTSEWQTYRWGSVAPADKVASLLDSTGTLASDERVVGRTANPLDVERELRAQIERALSLGIHPTHVDSHMGALYTTPELFATYVKVAHEYHLPFRAVRNDPRAGRRSPFTARDILLDATITASPQVDPNQWKAFYLNAIANLVPGLTEIVVHLGHDNAELQAVTVNHPAYGSAWRQRDYDLVTSTEFRNALREHHVILVTWRDVQKAEQDR